VLAWKAGSCASRIQDLHVLRSRARRYAELYDAYRNPLAAKIRTRRVRIMSAISASDGKAIDAMNSMSERVRFNKGLFAWMGFRSIGVPFNVPPRHGSGGSRWRPRQLLRFGLDGIAYLGSWGGPAHCPSLGVRLIDVRDPASPRPIGSVAVYQGTTAEHLAVVHYASPTFMGTVLFAGIQRCQPAGGQAGGLGTALRPAPPDRRGLSVPPRGEPYRPAVARPFLPGPRPPARNRQI